MTARVVASALLALLVVGCVGEPPAPAPTASRTQPARASILASAPAGAASSFESRSHLFRLAASYATSKVIGIATYQRVGLPPEWISLTLSGDVEYREINGERYVLFTREKTGFRTWDGFMYSASGSPPPYEFVEGSEIKQAAAVAPKWWWVRMGRVVVVEMKP